jgi:glutathione S-transferase
MSIELYVFPPSPRAFKTMAVANHLGLEWTLRLLDLPKGEHMTPQYGALNPNMRMPTLRDGDYVLWESNAICQYLASKKPESGLLPKDERARFDVTRWQFWDLAHWDPACAVFAYEYVVKPFVLRSGEPDMAAVAKPRRQGAGRPAQGQAVRDRRYPDGRGLLSRRGNETCRHRALSDRALR